MQRISRAERRRSSRELAKRPQWRTLEEFTRSRIQSWLQEVLEEEVSDLLGRGKSERRAAVDAPAGYRNGHGKPRRLSMMAGTIEVKRPRVRGLEQRFESRLLPLFVRRTETVGELLPQLYLHGLAQGDFELALRGLLGDGGAALGGVDRAAAGEVATGIRGLAKPAAGQARSSVRLGRWSVCESGP
ncbi:MAG: transposase [Terriglobales bacterium]